MPANSQTILPQFAGKLIDSHCHLNDVSFDADRAEVVRRAQIAGLTALIDIGIDLPTSQAAISNAKEFAGVVYAAIGLDPEILIPGSALFDEDLLTMEQDQFTRRVNEQISQFEELYITNRAQVVMIGETGMDGYHLGEKLKHGEISQAVYQASLERQQVLFVEHIKLANKLNLPLSVHSRGLEQECLSLLVANQGRGIMHCFTGDHEVLKQILDSGNGVGVSAIYTYSSGKHLLTNLKAEIQSRNIDSQDIGALNGAGIFLETDAPYLPLRNTDSKRNEPSTVAQLQRSL